MAETAAISILLAMSASKVWRSLFSDASWRPWMAFLAALFGLPMDEAMAEMFRACTGRLALPTRPFSEAAIICGRRAGKSRILALIAVFLACFVDWTKHLAPGEVATIPIICVDRAQARTIIRYCKGLLEAVPELAALQEGEHSQRITLPSRRIVIEVATASFQLTRGYSFAAVLADEIAFLSTSEDSAASDTEIIRALRPGLLTLRPAGSLLLMASSPYSRAGVLWEAYRRYYGIDDAPVLVWKAASRVMNPTLSESEIAKAIEEDPDGAASEYLAEFRRDVSALLDRATVESLVVPGRGDLPPVRRVAYKAFVDPSGGSSDSMTLCVGHSEMRDGVQYAVVDCLREIRAPFDPDSACKEFAGCLLAYNLLEVTGDRYGGDWPASRFSAHGITYIPSEQPKSSIYLAALPLINSRRVELPDNPRLVAQLCSLERRTGRGTGRDVIDHPPRQHDDLANVTAAIATLVAGQPSAMDILALLVGKGPLSGPHSASPGIPIS
jgi:hypothetical protein